MLEPAVLASGLDLADLDLGSSAMDLAPAGWLDYLDLLDCSDMFFSYPGSSSFLTAVMYPFLLPHCSRPGYALLCVRLARRPAQTILPGLPPK